MGGRDWNGENAPVLELLGVFDNWCGLCCAQPKLEIERSLQPEDFRIRLAPLQFGEKSTLV